MFAHLNGVISRIDVNAVIIDVNGVGYRVMVPVNALAALPAVGGKALVHIHTYIREDEISLYGFLTPIDQKVFELLLSVSGIGPKVALSILSAMEAGDLARTIAAEDTRTLTRIPGLGAKTSQRLVLELKDKMANFAFEQRAGVVSSTTITSDVANILDDVVEGLVGLGYNRNDSRKAAERAMKQISDKSSMPDALKTALNILTGVGK